MADPTGSTLSANGTSPLDYHTHSRYSPDSRATLDEMCRAALRQGLREIAFTEHLDNHPGGTTGYYRPAEFFAGIDAARETFAPQGLTVRAGIEVGELHRYRAQVQPVLDAYPYDVVLGSLHWVGDASVFSQRDLSAVPLAESVNAYFEELAVMARAGGFDVLAHPDVIKRRAFEVYGEFPIEPHRDAVCAVWRACIDNGIAIEINTAGLRWSVQDAHPALAALRWYRELGGDRLTIGSDAHRPPHVAYGSDTALAMARAAGFDRLCIFEQRQVVDWVAI